MKTPHAIRFLPPRDGHSVPLKLYAEATLRVAEALRSVRFAVARRLAHQLSLAPGEADKIVTLNVEPLRPGSLVTPLRVGPEQHLGIYGDLDQLFWGVADPLIRAAVLGEDNTLSIAAAESLVAAGELAQEEGYGLSLAEYRPAPKSGADKRRRRSGWAASIDVVKSVPALRSYAERKREAAHRNTVHIVGEVVELSAKPPSFRLDTQALGRVRVEASRVAMSKVAALFGQHALVVVEGTVDGDGGMREFVASDLLPVVHSRTLVKDWEATRGTLGGREVWGGADADEYIRDLRKRPS